MPPPASVFLDGGKGHSVMGKSFQCKPETPKCQGSPYIQDPRWDFGRGDGFVLKVDFKPFYGPRSPAEASAAILLRVQRRATALAPEECPIKMIGPWRPSMWN